METLTAIAAALGKLFLILAEVTGCIILTAILCGFTILALLIAASVTETIREANNEKKEATQRQKKGR